MEKIDEREIRFILFAGQPCSDLLTAEERARVIDELEKRMRLAKEAGLEIDRRLMAAKLAFHQSCASTFKDESPSEGQSHLVAVCGMSLGIEMVANLYHGFPIAFVWGWDFRFGDIGEAAQEQLRRTGRATCLGYDLEKEVGEVLCNSWVLEVSPSPGIVKATEGINEDMMGAAEENESDTPKEEGVTRLGRQSQDDWRIKYLALPLWSAYRLFTPKAVMLKLIQLRHNPFVLKGAIQKTISDRVVYILMVFCADGRWRLAATWGEEAELGVMFGAVLEDKEEEKK